MPHIDTIVFDMGGVLMEWNPLKLARTFTTTEKDAQLIAREVYGGREWQFHDAGAISADTVAWAAQQRLPERLRATAFDATHRWFEHRSMLSGMDELIRTLKQDGYGIYLLSNAGEEFVKYQHSLPAIECFDGKVVSCFEKIVKPEPAIYHILCERYGLTPQTCLFVDDMSINVAAAKRVGMQGYHYDGNVERLKEHIYAIAQAEEQG